MSPTMMCPKVAPWARLALRVLVGFVFLRAGWMKLQDPAMVEGMLTGMNFPLPALMAWVLILVELVGGALLMLGLWTGYNTIPLMIVMLVAFFVVHMKGGFKESQLVLLLFLVLLGFHTAGAGEMSLDHKMSKK